MPLTPFYGARTVRLRPALRPLGSRRHFASNVKPVVFKKPLHVVLDIDDCIASGFERDSVATVLKEYPALDNFARRDLFIQAVYPHMLHPGVVEFIRTLDRWPQTQLSFFSGGARERNDVFVEALMARALGHGRERGVERPVRVYSREHLTQQSREESRVQYETYGISWGNYKKDLKKCLLRNENLAWTVLIEDDSTYAPMGQEKNFLVIPGAASYHFRDLSVRDKNYDDFIRINHIFYATGLLVEVLEKALSEKTTLAEKLFEVQFSPRPEAKTFKPQYMALAQKFHYYERGLAVLKQENPALEFLLPAQSTLDDFKQQSAEKESFWHSLCM